MTRRHGRRRTKLLDDLKDRTAYSNLKEKLWIAIYGGIVLEEALNLSSNRPLDDDDARPRQLPSRSNIKMIRR